MNSKHPDKPEGLEAQVDLIWEAVFNHLPSQLTWLNTKFNFMMGFMALILALIGVVIVLVK